MPCCLCHPPLGAEDKQKLHPPTLNRLTFSFQSFSFSRIFFGGSGGLSNGTTLQRLLLRRRHGGGGMLWCVRDALASTRLTRSEWLSKNLWPEKGLRWPPLVVTSAALLLPLQRSVPVLFNGNAGWRLWELLLTPWRAPSYERVGLPQAADGCPAPPEVPVLHALFLFSSCLGGEAFQRATRQSLSEVLKD